MADEENLERQYERNEHDELQTYAWLRRRIGLPPGTLYAFVHDGRIPHVRLGKRLVRFRPSNIERWLKQHTVAAAP